MIDNPFTLLLEYFYVFFKWLRAKFNKLKLRLFPRHERIFGSAKDAYITGKLSFKSKKENRKPITHMKVVLWARTKLFAWRKLAEGFTDANGVFRMEFDLRTAVQWSNKKNLIFEVHEIDQIYFDQNRTGHRRFSVFHKQVFPKSDLIGMGYNLREIQLDYWNYRTDTTVPRTLLEFDNGDKIQDYSQARKDAMVEQIIPIELTKRRHLRLIERNSTKISYKSIQADYPKNFTQYIEEKLPGYTRGDEWFGERMMNGMNCGAFTEDPEEKGVFILKYFGNCNYANNGIYALPDVVARFRLNEKGIPIPFKITTRGALNALNPDPWQTRDFTPADGEMLWLAAKRIVRSVGNVCTEVDEHFAGTHLNVEQYAIAAYRNFKFSPLAVLLLPHMREVSLINSGADKIIINGFLPRGTALIAEGLEHRVKDLLGMFDWKGWQPMKAISADHRYAQAETLFWQVCSDYVAAFFEQNKAGILQHWNEVFDFSNDLVEHSVPVYLSDKDLSTLSKNEREQALERFEYYKFQYGLDENHSRERINNELKVVSRITAKQKITANDVEDFANLQKACTYAIMQATFMHTWINEHQYDDLGEVIYSCGGLRFGEKESGVLVPETDLSVAPSLTIAAQQLWFANFLSRTEYGFITKNEDGDVNPIFTELLLAQKDAFAKMGVDIDDIESRTNI